MPDQDFNDAMGEVLSKLYDPESGLDKEGLTADIEFLEKKRDRMLENLELTKEEEERLTMKVDAQIRLLKETRDVFFKNREAPGDD